MRVLRLAVDELPAVDVLTDAGDLAAVHAGIARVLARCAVSTHRLAAGGEVLVNWRAVGQAHASWPPDAAAAPAPEGG